MLIFLFTLVAWLEPTLLFAERLLSFTQEQKEYIIGPSASVLIDSTNQLKLADVLRVEAKRFRLVNHKYPKVDDIKPAYWYRFVVHQSAANNNFLLDVAFGNIYQIDLYIIDSVGNVQNQIAGDRLGPKSRPIPFPTYVFPLSLRPNETYTIYLRISNPTLHGYFPLVIREESAFLGYSQQTTLLWGFYWGILILMFLYHIIIWGFTRERGYLYLGLYLLSYIGFELSRGSNLGIRYIWSESAWFVSHGLEFFSTLVLFAFTGFYGRMLNLRNTVRPLFYALNGLCGLGGLLLLNTMFVIIPVSSQTAAILSSYPLVLIMFLAGLITWQRGQQTSRFYIIASMCYAAGFTVFVLNRTGVLPGMGLLTHYSQNIGSLFEILFMSVGLADYVRTQRRQRLQEERRHAVTQQLRLTEQLHKKQELDNALIDGQIQERRRVADGLHDQLGSVLFGIRTHLTELERTAPKIEPETLRALIQTVQEGYNEVRLISHNLWPDELEKNGLSKTMLLLTNSLNRFGKTRFALQLSGVEDELGRTARFHIYCICLELVTNILKHADASEASIRFVADDNDLRLSVRDDGVGFGPESSDGQGLRSVEERVSKLRGSLNISHLPEGEGSWIQIHIPIRDPQDKNRAVDITV